MRAFVVFNFCLLKLLVSAWGIIIVYITRALGIIIGKELFF